MSAPPPLPPKTRRGPPATVLAPPAANHGEEATTISSNDRHRHVVSIRINTGDDDGAQTLRVPVSGYSEAAGCVRISVGGGAGGQDMVRRVAVDGRGSGPYFFCNGLPCSGATTVISSGQSSPSDTLDSGTCSDLDGGTPPPPPPKKRPAAVTLTVNGTSRGRAGSLSSGAEVGDSDDDDRISCDSLNSGDVSHPGSDEGICGPTRYEATATITLVNGGAARDQDAPEERLHSPVDSGGLPRGLLQDIRERTSRLSLSPEDDGTQRKTQWDEEARPVTPQTTKHQPLSPTSSTSSTCSVEEAVSARRPGSIVQQRTYEERRREAEHKDKPQYDMDVFYKFHINERFDEPVGKGVGGGVVEEEESFAGYKDLMEGRQASSTIRSAKGTVRGVKNRVRAGITTFLQLHATKSYKEKEVGKVVLYTTTMGVVRRTHQDCVNVKKILRNLMVKYEERDVFMSREVQAELRDRINSDLILVPQMFVEGQLVGDAEAIEKLNESGELRRFLKPYRSPDACSECRVCGGHHLLPCPVCSGSKKSVHRNHFTAEFVALKCMNCDEVGLVKCHAC